MLDEVEIYSGTKTERWVNNEGGVMVVITQRVKRQQLGPSYPWLYPPVPL